MIAAEKFNQFKINGPPKAHVLLPDGNYNLNLDANYYVVAQNARSSSSTSR